MCLPLIGAAIGAVGSIASGMAQSQSYKAQSQFQQRQASIELQRGAYEGERLKDRHDRQLATMRGQFLSSGIALEGSAADVLEDSATDASLDEQAVRYGAQVRSDNLTWESKMSRMNAGNAVAGGMLGALGTMVGGISQQMDQNSQRTLIRNPYAAYGGI